MSQSPPGVVRRAARILMTEEAIYGLILVSGMIVVSGSAVGTSINALLTVVLTVVVFFAAHVYAGALSRMAASAGGFGAIASVRAAARHSAGMLFASVCPILILLLGTTRVVDDDTAIWTALIVNTLLLAALGWVAVARWSPRWHIRLLGALITAAFGGAVILIKAVISH